LTRALEEYRALLEAGERPDREAFLARHAELGSALADCLAGLELVHAVAPALSGTGAEFPDGSPGDALLEPLGDFHIIREVGRGGMGVVYEAEQRSLGRRVALKVLPFAAMMDPRHLRRFQNEARAAASLEHPHIVPVYGVGCERGVHYYAMKFIEGQSLAALIQQERGETSQLSSAETPAAPGAATTPAAPGWTEPTPRGRAVFRQVAEWGIQAAEALEHAHSVGIVHRDIKPANLMIDSHGALWITDFGLARTAADAGLTITGDVLGTLRYMSPEQALAKHGLVDHHTDVYSLGLTLYELLPLEPAIRGRDREEILNRITLEEPRAPRACNTAIPRDLETIVLRAMEKNPGERYAMARELADDLRRFLDGQLIRARPPTPWHRARKWMGRHRPAVSAAAVCLVVSMVAAGSSAAWALGERAARQRETEGKVLEALDAARPILLVGNPHDPALLAAVQRAEAPLGSGTLGAELRRQVEQLRQDHQMLAQLEQARLQRTSVKDGHFDWEAADRAYEEAFRWYGFDPEQLDPQEAAEWIRGRPIARHLVAAIGHWARTRKAGGGQGWEQLLALARAADPDDLRRRLREAVDRKDRTTVEELAASAAVDDLPSATLLLLGEVLGDVASPERKVALLRRAQSSHPADFWINHELGSTLCESRPPQLEEAIRYNATAVALRPHSPGARVNLGNALTRKGRLDQAMAEYREAIRLKEDYAGAHICLGNALRKKGLLDEAIAECREAIRLKKDHPVARASLGVALWEKGLLNEAIAECREAIRVKNDYAEAHVCLSIALREKGLLNEAITECREAVRLKNDLPEAHLNLGVAVWRKGRLDEAIAEWRETIHLEPDNSLAHFNIGNALRDKRQLGEAITEYREAIRLRTNYAEAHNNLGGVLAEMGRLDEAVAQFREAIRRRQDFPTAHYNLGLALKDKGQFAEALVYLRRGHELGSKDPRWPHPSAQWIQQCERLVELDGKLSTILNGPLQPANTAERLTLALMCQQHKQLHAAAARFYGEAFAAQPAIAEDLRTGHRYNAACAAVLAGCGRGKDADKLDTNERARLRRQALDWLQGDLAAWRKVLDGNGSQAGAAVRQQMQHWLEDSDFAGVRGEAALAKLPEAERRAWQKLWADVAETLARAQAKAAPAKKPDAK
jgi:serine/threonine protein kinase/Flp pilus assembly protein TadD